MNSVRRYTTAEAAVLLEEELDELELEPSENGVYTQAQSLLSQPHSPLRIVSPMQ
jgi:hypothetical protein